MIRTTLALALVCAGLTGCGDDTAGGTAGITDNNGANNGVNNGVNNGGVNNGGENNGANNGGNNGANNGAAPVVAFTSPASDAVVGGAVVLAVDVTGAASKVDFFVNGTLLGSVDAAPWTVSWDVAALTSGPYTLTASATGASGATADAEISVNVDTEAPRVTLVQPGTIELADLEIGFDAEVSDNYGISAVTVAVGDSDQLPIQEPWVGTVDVSGFAAGTYQVTVTATDQVGLVAADFKEFEVDRAPSIAFVSPGDGETLSAPTVVVVEAADDVALETVELYADGELVGEFQNGSLLWEPSFALETAMLRAVATDSRGQTAEAVREVNLELPTDYDFEGGLFSWVSSMELETDGNIGADVDDDGQVDNSLGPLLRDLGNLIGGFDVNAQFGESIRTGQLVLGMGWPGDLNTQNDTGVRIDILDLDDTDDNPSTHDEYFASEASFLPGTQVPRTRFSGVAVVGGEVEAGPSIFRLVLPFGPITLTIEIHRAVLRGGLASHNGGVALRDGTLSGAVPWASLIGALNDFLRSPNCSCLGLEDDLIDAEARSCGRAQTDTCEAMGQGICGTLAGACGLAVPLLAANLDIDLDGQNGTDAFSAYLHIGAEGTDVLGLTP